MLRLLKSVDSSEVYVAGADGYCKGIYDYYVGMSDTTCYFGGGWEPEPGEYDPTTRDWYKAALTSNDVQVSEAYVDAETGRVVITMSMPGLAALRMARLISSVMWGIIWTVAPR